MRSKWGAIWDVGKEVKAERIQKRQKRNGVKGQTQTKKSMMT